jgi:hypothetical protein
MAFVVHGQDVQAPLHNEKQLVAWVTGLKDHSAGGVVGDFAMSQEPLEARRVQRQRGGRPTQNCGAHKQNLKKWRSGSQYSQILQIAIAKPGEPGFV